MTRTTLMLLPAIAMLLLSTTHCGLFCGLGECEKADKKPVCAGEKFRVCENGIKGNVRHWIRKDCASLGMKCIARKTVGGCVFQDESCNLDRFARKCVGKKVLECGAPEWGQGTVPHLVDCFRGEKGCMKVGKFLGCGTETERSCDPAKRKVRCADDRGGSSVAICVRKTNGKYREVVIRLRDGAKNGVCVVDRRTGAWTTAPTTSNSSSMPAAPAPRGKLNQTNKP